ncbi:MAG: Integration host factor subunit alpha [uncultured bacterium]|nr:MAG: Integration host factor subunit alpha [uncultured bacterium]OFW68768.1 MAG: integration host factor subunit alpha [Alphaproteobacteria bacterium GWC2_42_16]OFW73275.1 MAG: integration host factor subunit alpha [Alphaproteobacteria bacterium GWA2_41_27]OFW81892.1 MAG: integration host factor subunit alpha [Alphaproteobacteria bacterium RIFCSPHIGHO2_12_FULL_42_100]OFW84883.1 MAG: integration host factor subunit alpha [Alphaproteobacteria bacterium RBG_16_42_14]OFW91002.1 MAG: integration
MKTTTLTRADISDTLVREVDMPRQRASEFLEAVLNNVIESLVAKGTVKVSSFGSFNVRQKARRVGRNPKTGKEAIISPRRVITFKPSQYMKEKVQRRKE